MGLFSLFGGGKKKEAAAKAEAALAKAEASAAATGVAQAKLRLKMAASLRSGERAAAYAAAKGLADIQAKAGRRVGVRVWTAEAEKIKAGMAA